MQNRQGNYEKVILTISSLLAIGAAGFLIFQSSAFEDSLLLAQGASRDDLNAPDNAAVVTAIDTIKKKYAWLSPVRSDKPVPLNKSVLLVMKSGELFDLLLPEPQLRPPMTNIFLTGDRTKNPPEAELPNIYSPNVGDLDADNDGFSNLEEFNAKTDPRSDSSMPPLTSKLVLRQRISHDYVLVLKGGSDGTFQIQRLQPSKGNVFKPLNEEFGFDRGVTRFKLLEAQKQTIQHPTLGPMEAYVVKALDLSTNKPFELVQGKETNLAEYEAELEFRWKKLQPIPGLKEGKTFQLPGLGKTYHIWKLEENKAVISPLGSDGRPTPEKIEIQQG
jgi:hypothetical protein